MAPSLSKVPADTISKDDFDFMPILAEIVQHLRSSDPAVVARAGEVIFQLHAKYQHALALLDTVPEPNTPLKDMHSHLAEREQELDEERQAYLRYREIATSAIRDSSDEKQNKD
ncbi:hypothetical protein BC828DRAFT_385905 [Blastocladiella britannica]|nr:hypothetical protein BC828DRAFT_385905 [Blastocladiella britannica]